MTAILPRRRAPPLMIDLSLSEVARGRLMMAAEAGRAILKGCVLDAAVQPTADPKAGLADSMLPQACWAP